jgi:anionic cell wall polymer biosynthesis LytR-Cps2A-Psr (LCP) family protein
MSDAGDFADFFTQQICTSHWYGNDAQERNDNLANSVTALLGGFPVGRYYVMSMEDIGTVNDAIGGVTVTIPTDMTVADPAFTEGASVHLEGDQAEKFLRARMDLEDDTNAARMSRQEQYIKNAYSMIIDKVKENPEYINDLYQGLEGVFETDGNGKDLSKATNRMIQFENNGFIRFDGKTKLGDTFGDGEEHEETYVDEQSILEELKKVVNLEDYVDTEEVDEEEEEMFIDPDDVE